MTAARAEGPAVGQKSFPDDDWLDELKHYVKRGSPLVTVLGTEVNLPAPGPLARGECAAVGALADLRSVERETEIASQLETTGVVGALIRAMKKQQVIFDEAEHHLSDIASYALGRVEDPIFRLKAHFNRARPWHCDPELRRLFPKGHPAHPGHPSYPSGHSTQAHTVAFLFARRAPQLKDVLLMAAARIALNREIAGLHFPSDSAAGRMLGEAFADAIIEAPKSHQDDDWLAFRRRYDALDDI